MTGHVLKVADYGTRRKGGPYFIGCSCGWADSHPRLVRAVAEAAGTDHLNRVQRDSLARGMTRRPDRGHVRPLR